MTDDVWDAGGEGVIEDFGAYEPMDSPAAEITIGNLVRDGLKLLQTATVPLLLGGGALWVIGFVGNLLAQFANLGGSIVGSTSGDPVMEQLAGLIPQLAVQLVAAPLLWIAFVSILSTSAKAIVHGDQEPSAAIPSASSLLSFIVVMFLNFLIQLPFVLVMLGAAGVGYTMGGNELEKMMYALAGMGAGILIIFLPSFYIGLRLRLAPAAAIVEGSGVEAIKRSWAATREPMVLVHLFLFMLIEVGVGLVNVLLCCTFGLLTVVTVPFFQGALIAAYLRATRSTDVLGAHGFMDD